MAQLRYLDEADHIRTMDVGGTRFVIGRVASCNITFVDDMVSREHAQIEPTKDGRLRIRDLGSRNKTYVNGQLVTETVLAGGDVVRIGDHVLEFLDDARPTGKIDLEFLTPDREEPAGSEWIKTKAPVTLALDQVGRLAGLAQYGSIIVRPEDVADAALAHLIVDLQAERGFVALRGESKKDLRVIAHRALARASGESLTPVSQSFVYPALLQQAAGRYPATAGQIDPKSGYAASGMVAPLLYRNETVGVVYVDRPAGKKTFTAMALQQFTAAGAQLGSLLATASRRVAQTALSEGAAFMSNIKRSQALLTPTLPDLPDFEVASQLLPGQGRCGDTCDLIAIDEGSVCAVVVDAGGNGSVGLAQAAAIRTALWTGLTAPHEPPDLGTIFSTLNRSMIGLPGRQFIACCAVHIDVAAGRMTYVNAGAPMPLLIPAATRMQSLDQPSLVLGADATFDYEASTVDLPPQFRLLLHTDGLIDSANASGQVFGEDGLKDVLLDREAFAAPAQMTDLVAKAFTNHLAGHPQADDALILVVGK